jgi:hypothetical protein
MRKQIFVVAGVCVVALALAAGVAWAAGMMKVEVPFAFTVKDKEMPAGRYEIQPDGGEQSRLVIRSTSGGGTIVVPVLERLADTGSKTPKIVFDQVQDKHYLSEVHIPGMDGFLVGITKGEEKHEVVTGNE